MIAIKDMPMPRNCYECWFEDANRCYLNIIPHIESLDRPEWCPLVEAEPFNCSLEEFGECSYRETGCSDCKVKEKVRNAINKAEPKHGRWIIIDGKVACSECYEPNFETDYCPNCGARMDEVEE